MYLFITDDIRGVRGYSYYTASRKAIVEWMVVLYGMVWYSIYTITYASLFLLKPTNFW